MTTVHFTVQGMSCTGCTARLARALDAIDSVTSTDIVLETGLVTVDGEGIEADAIKTTITDAGFVVI